MSSCHPSTQRALTAMPVLPVLGRKGLGAAMGATPLRGKTHRAGLSNPVPNPKRTLNAHVIIKVHEVGAP